MKNSAYKTEEIENVTKGRETTEQMNNNVGKLLPEKQKIVVEKVFETSSPVILDYYYKLCNKGEFGNRVAQLIYMDAHGQIPKLYNTKDLSTEEKLDMLLTKIARMADITHRGQRLTEATISNQSSIVKKLTDLGKDVRDQKLMLDIIRTVLKESGQFDEQQILDILKQLEN